MYYLESLSFRSHVENQRFSPVEKMGNFLSIQFFAKRGSQKIDSFDLFGQGVGCSLDVDTILFYCF